MVKTVTKSPRATYQDVLDAPPNKVAEVIDGKLSILPRPRTPHAMVISRLGMRIGSRFDIDHSGPGGWWIVDEPELHLGEDILVPDLGGWRRERMPECPNAAYFTRVSDWTCEVLSRSTRKLDLGVKQQAIPERVLVIVGISTPMRGHWRLLSCEAPSGC